MEQLLTQLKESWEMHKTAWLIGLALVLGGGGYWYHQTTSAPPVLPQRQSAPVKSAPGSAAPANTGKVVVDVKGAVNHPGVLHPGQEPTGPRGDQSRRGPDAGG